MADLRQLRISREIFLAGLGMEIESLDPWVIDRMTRMLDEQDFRVGEALFSRGEAPDSLYFIHDGEVRLSKPGSAPWTFKGRWLIGTYDAFSEQGHTRDAIAMTDFPAMKLPRTAWIDLLEDSAQIARGAVINSARAVARLEDLLPVLAAAPLPIAEAQRPAPPSPLSLVDRLAALVDVRMLRGAGVQALVDLAASSEEVAFDRGDVLHARGVAREQMILLVEGEVVSTRIDPAAERRTLPGEIIGGASAFGTQALPWEARATTRARGIAFAIEAWFDLMEEHFDLVQSTLGALLARRELLLDRLAEASGGIVLT